MTSMEHEAIKLGPGHNPQDLELEEGEVSDESDDGYTPLQRPELATIPRTEFAGGASVSQVRNQMDIILSDQDDLNDDDDDPSSDDDDDSDLEAGGAFGKRMRTNNDRKLRIKPPLEKIPPPRQGNSRGGVGSGLSSSVPNKYNVWTESLQEDTLMETMRGCDVTLNGMRNRDVESYDYSLKYRMNGGNAYHRALKRRQSNSDDSDGFGGGKRFRSTSFGGVSCGVMREQRKSAKLRLGKRNSSDESQDSFQNAPRFASRHILDLNVADGCTYEVFAAELARKLCEEKDDLMLRVVNVLGKEIPAKLFKETQKIEADGGMLIMNGARRRTPGGVFLFLLKHNEEIDKDDKRSIFLEEKKAAIKERKVSQAVNRGRAVEELKATLKAADNELHTRGDLLLVGHMLKPETHSTLSNPPPSPVGDENREGSPDFHPQNVHVNVTSPEKPHDDPKEQLHHHHHHHHDPASIPQSSSHQQQNPNPTPQLQQPGQAPLASYDDDFLDMTCDDMDLF